LAIFLRGVELIAFVLKNSVQPTDASIPKMQERFGIKIAESG